MLVLVRVQVAPPILSSAGLRFALAAKTLHQIHARERHVELVAARVFDQHVIAFGIALRDFANAEELADAVLHVDHVIAGFQIELIGGENSRPGVGLRWPGDGLRRFEQIFRAEDRQTRFLKHGPARHIAADQRDSGAQRLRALAQILGDLLAAEIDLIGNRVFAENIGQPLHFAGRGREEGEADARFEQRFRFADGHLQIAVERHRGAGGNVKGVLRRRRRPISSCRISSMSCSWPRSR